MFVIRERLYAHPVFTFSGKRLIFAHFFYLSINFFSINGQEWENLDYVSNTLNIYLTSPCKRQSNPITGLDRPRVFQEVEDLRFQDNRHMTVVRFSALRTGRI
jgi:hypothetical protein